LYVILSVIANIFVFLQPLVLAKLLNVLQVEGISQDNLLKIIIIVAFFVFTIAGDFTWTITDVTTTSEIGQSYGDTFLGEKANGVFVILDVKVENTGKTAKYLSDSYIKLIDDQDREFTASTMDAIYLKPEGSALMFEQLNPGIVKTGKIVYDVPKGLKVANVKVTSSLFTTEQYTVKINIP
jgi:hypothetical protein